MFKSISRVAAQALPPTQPYIVFHDLPRLSQLRQCFPELYR